MLYFQPSQSITDEQFEKYPLQKIQTPFIVDVLATCATANQHLALSMKRNGMPKFELK